MIRIFAGFDKREAIGYHTFVQSILENTSADVAITPLRGLQSDGSNAFTYKRFHLPEMCDFDGWAIFADASDMLCVGDISELWALRDESKAVQVVKHNYQTKHPRKYIGTPMETDNADYPRKNWSSLILWNCGHHDHFDHRRELAGFDGAYLHRFRWLDDELIGDLPFSWNWLADEYGENIEANLLHWTAGQPGFYHYKNAPHSDAWRKSVRNVLRGMD